jgi:hypothetical protein
MIILLWKISKPRPELALAEAYGTPIAIWRPTLLDGRYNRGVLFDSIPWR